MTEIWIVPIRRGGNEKEILCEAKTIEEAKKILKDAELYYKNVNKQTGRKKVENQSYSFWLEVEYCEEVGIRQTRFPEKVPYCEHRKINGGEYNCGGNLDHPGNRCVIEEEIPELGIPEECFYLKGKTNYISFIED